jgi:hypothetical protein
VDQKRGREEGKKKKRTDRENLSRGQWASGRRGRGSEIQKRRREEKWRRMEKRGDSGEEEKWATACSEEDWRRIRSVEIQNFQKIYYFASRKVATINCLD